MTEPLNASKNPLATSRNWRIGSIVLFAMSLSAATLIGVGTGNVLLALGRC